MPGSPNAAPPYSLPPHRFPFPALAAQAARAPLGGAREAALACLMAARLGEGACRDPLATSARAARAARARAWFASLALPAALRAPAARVADGIASERASDLAGALAALLAAARRHLDAHATAELERVVEALRAC